MKCVRFSRYLPLLAISVAVAWTTALTAQESVEQKKREKKNSAVVPEARPDSKGWMDRHEAINARVKQGNVDLIFIGDSITQGWEGAGKNVWRRFYGNRNAVNLGISGDRTQHVLWRLDHGNIDGISPKLAVVMIGTNNTSANTPEEIFEGIKEIVGRLQTKLPETKVLLMAIFPRGPNNDDPRRQVLMKVNEMLPKLADGRMVRYLDISPMLLDPDGTLDKKLMPDLLHPLAKGYEIWAEAIDTAVADMLGEKENPLLPVPLDPDRWLKRHEALNARVKQGNADLIFIGDSITEGWEHDGKEAWDKFYGKRNAVNLGVNGDRTQHVLWRLEHGNVDGISPKLAVVLIGANNLTHSAPEQVPEGVKAVVDKLREKLPATKILLLGIFPRGRAPTDRLRQAGGKVNEAIAKLADDKDVFYLDVGYRFLEEGGVLRPDFIPDGLHPAPIGYTVWAEAIESMVTKLMGERENTVLPLPRDAAWIERLDTFQKRADTERVNLIFIGSSIAAGWDEAGQPVWNEYYGRRGALNMSIAGDKTQNILWRLGVGIIRALAPRVAVVSAGADNIGGADDDATRATPEAIAAGVKAIVDDVREQVPQTSVLLLGILPRGATKDSRLRQLTVETNELLAKLADNHGVVYLDLGPKFLAEDGTLRTELLPDPTHLSPKGYGVWAQSMEQTLARMMGDKP